MNAYPGHAGGDETIAEIKARYEKEAAVRLQQEVPQESQPTTGKISGYKPGDIWYNCVSNEYFICNGRINGTANWVRILDPEL